MELGFWQRIGLAFAVFFRTLFDRQWAGQLAAFRALGAIVDPAQPAIPTPPTRDGAANRSPPIFPDTGVTCSPIAPERPPLSAEASGALERGREEGALLLLSLMQSEGRFVDFVQQSLVGFDDSEVGAVARVVHGGCAKVLSNHLALDAVRTEPEGAALVLEPGFDPARVKLTGNLAGEGRLHGVLRHKGWLAKEVRLPQVLGEASARVLCPAEVEL
jgi:hypothetical protein